MPTYPPATKTYVDGDYLTFTEINAVVGDNGALHWLKNALATIGVTADTGDQTLESGIVGCRVAGNAQEIQDSVWTPVSWSTQRWGRHNGQDIDYLVSGYPTFVHLPTKPEDAMWGYFLIGAHVAWAGNTTGSRGLRIVSHDNKVQLTSYFVLASKNKEASAGGAVMTMSIMAIDDEQNAGGGSYALQVYQNSGDTLGLQQIANSSPEMWIVKVGAETAT